MTQDFTVTNNAHKHLHNTAISIATHMDKQNITKFQMTYHHSQTALKTNQHLASLHNFASHHLASYHQMLKINI